MDRVFEGLFLQVASCMFQGSVAYTGDSGRVLHVRVISCSRARIRLWALGEDGELVACVGRVIRARSPLKNIVRVSVGGNVWVDDVLEVPCRRPHTKIRHPIQNYNHPTARVG